MNEREEKIAREVMMHGSGESSSSSKGYCTRKVLCVVTVLLILAILGGAITWMLQPTSPEKLATPHKHTCGDLTFDILIEGDSVKLGPKVFSPDEILRLKSYNSKTNETTYEIF